MLKTCNLCCKRPTKHLLALVERKIGELVFAFAVQVISSLFVQLQLTASMTTPRKYAAFLPCGHLDSESAVTAQNDECKAVFIARIHASKTSKLSRETHYLASILSDTFVKCICRNISCALGKWTLHSR